MDLEQFVHRSPITPWSGGDKIPWADPEFSRRMLAEHLCQDHDAASRRADTVAEHLTWIRSAVLEPGPARVLDLGCGPGLYTCGLAERECECVGIDIGPASIAHARRTTALRGHSCAHVEADMREVGFGAGFDLVMVIFGELHAFRPQDAAGILARCHDALVPGGRLLLELSDHRWLGRRGREAPAWSTASAGLFSAEPHLTLVESAWDDPSEVASRRWSVVDAASGRVDTHYEHLQAYDDAALDRLIDESGLVDPVRHPSLGGAPTYDDGLFVVLASRPG